MSDLEKFKELFEDIGIGYVEQSYSNGEINISVSDSAIDDGYGSGLDILFSENGKFLMFYPSGE